MKETRLRGSDIPGWPNPDQDIIIYPKTPASVASWYFPHEEPRIDALRAELERRIDAAVAQAERGEPLRPSAADIAAYFTTQERPDLREGLREEIEELAEEARQSR